MKITNKMRFMLIMLSVLMVLSLFACAETPEETTTKAPEATTEKPTETTEKTEPTEAPVDTDATDAPVVNETTDVDVAETTENETESESASETASESATESDSASAETTETETTEAPACDHAGTVVDAEVAPTCENTGLTEGSHCAACGAVVVAQEVIPAKGHAYDEGKVTTEATCEDKGVKTFTCANDATHTYTEEIPAKGHAYDDGVVTTDPTCEGEGVKTFTCANDASHTYTEPVAANGHAFNGNWVLNEEKPGYFKDECANGCGTFQEKACEHEDITLGAIVAAAPLTTSFTCNTCGIAGATDKYNQNGGLMFGADALKELADTQTTKKNAEYSATVMVDEDQNDLPFTRFQLTAELAAGGEGFFYLVENGDEKLDFGGKVIFIIYRTGNGNVTGVFDTYASNGASWPENFNTTAYANYPVASDGQWRAAVLDHSTKSGWTADGVQQLRLDIFAASQAAATPAGAYTDIAYIGIFDTVDNAWVHYKSMLDVYKFETVNYQYSLSGLKINQQSETIALTAHTAYLDPNQKRDNWYSADLTGKVLTVKDQEITPQNSWISTPGGIKEYNIKITEVGGGELYNGTFRGVSDSGNSIISATANHGYGSDRYVGGTPSVGHVKLSAYSGKTVNIEIYVVTNYGQTIKLLVLTNCTIG